MIRSRRRWVRIGVIVLVAIIVIVLLFGTSTISSLTGLSAKRLPAQELSDLLRPGYKITKPSGAGPFRTAILLSGCDGPKDNLTLWAQALKAEGWASVIVDSHGPRDYDDAQIWRLICAGQLLPGAERAGDLAVALDDVRRMPFVDAGNLVAIGASHGGWTILDLLSLASGKRPPYNLRDWPGGSPEAALDGLRGGLLIYPYCGSGTLATWSGWTVDVPLHMFLAEGDVIADEKDCIKLATEMAAAGQKVTYEVLAGVTHGFDQTQKSALSILEFDPEATRKVMIEGIQFLNAVAPPG